MKYNNLYLAALRVIVSMSFCYAFVGEISKFISGFLIIAGIQAAFLYMERANLNLVLLLVKALHMNDLATASDVLSKINDLATANDVLSKIIAEIIKKNKP